MSRKLFTKQNAKLMGSRGGKARSRAQNLARCLNGKARSNKPINTLLRLAKTNDPVELMEFIMQQFVIQTERISRTKNVHQAFYMENRLMSQMIHIHKLKFGDNHQNLNTHIDVDTMKRRLEEHEDLIWREKKK